MSLDEFRARARRGASTASPRLVPVWRDVLLDTDTPVAAFAKLRHGPFAFLLESAPAGGETWARYTFMGTAPRAAWKLARRHRPRLDAGARLAQRPPSRRSARRSRGAAHATAEPVDAPEIGEFWSGAVGYFGYDVARLIERLPTPPARGVDVPDALFVFTDALVIFDNLRSQARVVVGARVEPNATDAQLDAAYDARDAQPSNATVERLRGPSALEPLDLDPSAPPAEGRRSYDTRQVSRRRRAHSRSTSSPATRSRCSSRGASTCRSTSRRRISIARCA